MSGSGTTHRVVVAHLQSLQAQEDQTGKHLSQRILASTDYLFLNLIANYNSAAHSLSDAALLPALSDLIYKLVYNRIGRPPFGCSTLGERGILA